MSEKRQDTLAGLLRLGTCLLLLDAAAFGRSGRLLGRDSQSKPSAPSSAARLAEDGSAVIVSTGLAPDGRGFGGPVPVEVRIRDGLVAGVAPILPNDETPMFFALLDEAGLWKAWNGLPPAVAATSRVDAVTGATFSSRAAIANVRAALASAVAEGAGAPPASAAAPPSAKSLAALAVILAAAILPLFTGSRTVRTVLLLLDVAVLGFWSGLFLSTARLVGWAGSGLPRDGTGFACAAVLLAMAFVYPLFGRRSHYCLNACPFGAAQELAGRIPVRKWRLSPRLAAGLTTARRVLWGLLMLSLWTGLWAGWLDLELFSVFAFGVARPLVIGLAAAVLVLSVFVPRPYCRFACPTGTLFKLAESNQAEPDRKEPRP